MTFNIKISSFHYLISYVIGSSSRRSFSPGNKMGTRNSAYSKIETQISFPFFFFFSNFLPLIIIIAKWWHIALELDWRRYYPGALIDTARRTSAPQNAKTPPILFVLNLFTKLDFQRRKWLSFWPLWWVRGRFAWGIHHFCLEIRIFFFLSVVGLPFYS